MIKTFEQFINENYNEKPVLALDEEYGAPLFNEVSESLMSEIHNSINEGRLVVDREKSSLNCERIQHETEIR